MAKFSYPGVYREEVRSQQRVAQAASTANLAVVSFFERGPVNEPVLVTDLDEAFRVFGDYTSKSLGPTSLASYYANGGQNAYVVRVVGAGAAAANGSFQKDEQQVVGTSTGGGVKETISSTLLETPIAPGSVTVEFTDPTEYDSEVIGTTDGTDSFSGSVANAPVAPGGVSVTDSSGTENFTDNADGTLTGANGGSGFVDYRTGAIELTYDSSAIPVADEDVQVTYTEFPSASGTASLDVVDLTYIGRLESALAPFNEWQDASSDTHAFIEFTWTDFTGTDAKATVASDGSISGDATGAVDQATGDFALKVASASAPQQDTNILVSYHYAVTTHTATDDGLGGFDTGTALDDSSVTPEINYETGEISFETAVIQSASSSIVVSYGAQTHIFSMKDPGAFGDNFVVTLQANENYLDSDTGGYSRFDLSVSEVDPDTGSVSGRGNFEALVLDDTSDADHVAQVINDPFTGSDLVEVSPSFSGTVPETLKGISVSALKIGEFAGVSPSEVSLKLPRYGGRDIIEGTLEITYGDYTITDDAQGGLEGDVALSSSASIDYETGLLTFTPSENGSLALAITASYRVTSSATAVELSLAGGNDGAAITREAVTDVGLSASDEGIYALDAVDELLIMALPDFAGDAQAERAAIAYAEERDDSMVIVSPPRGSSVKQAINYRRTVLASQSDRAAMYYPHIQIEDPVTRKTMAVPPHGHVAGIWAKTDANRNVGKAPAGTTDGALNFLLGFDKNLKEEEVGQLTQGYVNALWQPPRAPRAVWGARTLQVGGEFRYINKRRTVDFTSVTVARSMWWTVFENNGPQLWVRINGQVRGILRRFFAEGLYKGTTEEEAFFVTVDGSNNTQDVVEAGQLIVDYGVSTNTPAEFIRLRHRQIL